MDVNTLASKRSELIGNADILRMRRVIHNDSTYVCLRIPVAAITQKRKRRPVAGFKHVLVPLSLPSPSSITGVQLSVEHDLGDAVIGHPH